MKNALAVAVPAAPAAPAKKFVLKAKVYYDRYSDAHEKLVLEADTLKELRVRHQTVVEESWRGLQGIDISGSNWDPKAKVYGPSGKVIGFMAYNSTVRDVNGNEVVI